MDLITSHISQVAFRDPPEFGVTCSLSETTREGVLDDRLGERAPEGDAGWNADIGD